MTRRGRILLSGVVLTLAAAGLAPEAGAQGRAPGQAQADDIDRQLRADGWEFVGDVARTPVVPRGEHQEMLVLDDNRGYRRTSAPSDRAENPGVAGGIPRDFRPRDVAVGIDPHLGAGFSPGPVSPGPADLVADPTEPVGVLLGATDDRDVVTSGLTSYPVRTIGRLSTNCSGTLVGPRHVLTAAHCLYNDKGWFSIPTFSPGRAGADNPNGPPRKGIGRYARTFSLGMDYGLVILEDSPDTAKLGWMGMNWYNNLDSYAGKAVQNHGYPGGGQQCADSPLPDGTCGNFMYTDACNVDTATDAYLMYDCDTSKGHSGSAVWRWVNGGPAVVAVHKRGNEPASGAVETSDPPTLNLGPRVRPALFNDVCGWMKKFPSKHASHTICSP